MLKLEIGGNARLCTYFSYYNFQNEEGKAKFQSKAAEFYQEKLT